MDYEVAVVGAGVAGMATAARLRSRGLSTVVIEAHGYPGGCAGFFRRRGFAFDVGATTLVDFGPEGVGGDLLNQIGMRPIESDTLPGYRAWLPDCTVTLHRETPSWVLEREMVFGKSPEVLAFWTLLDQIASSFWKASRCGIRLPLRSLSDLINAVRALSIRDWPLTRFLSWSMGDLLRTTGLRGNKKLVGLLSMLIEDTVHSSVDEAPLINAALGITIRGAGLSRPLGGMCGFWKRFVKHYRSMGGELRLNCRVTKIERLSNVRPTGFLIHTSRGVIKARKIVSTLPISLTQSIASDFLGDALNPYLHRNEAAEGGALVVFLGVPEKEVADQTFAHHQLLESYDRPLENGNNMFISVSSSGDIESAPAGYRAVMISTHTSLKEWEGLNEAEYRTLKAQIGERLLSNARRIYPTLGSNASVFEIATPRTYERYTGRPRGSVGGFRLHRGNSNQRSVPHDIGVAGFWLAGDTTWPGLGTVACVLGSRIVSECVFRSSNRDTNRLSTMLVSTKHAREFTYHPIPNPLGELD